MTAPSRAPRPPASAPTSRCSPEIRPTAESGPAAGTIERTRHLLQARQPRLGISEVRVQFQRLLVFPFGRFLAPLMFENGCEVVVNLGRAEDRLELERRLRRPAEPR